RARRSEILRASWVPPRRPRAPRRALGTSSSRGLRRRPGLHDASPPIRPIQFAEMEDVHVRQPVSIQELLAKLDVVAAGALITAEAQACAVPEQLEKPEAPARRLDRGFLVLGDRRRAFGAALAWRNQQ